MTVLSEHGDAEAHFFGRLGHDAIGGGQRFGANGFGDRQMKRVEAAEGVGAEALHQGKGMLGVIVGQWMNGQPPAGDVIEKQSKRRVFDLWGNFVRVLPSRQ